MNEDLAVGYHQQDTNYYCGAACAQMVLDSVGAGLLNQDDLYNDNHNHSVIEAGWYTAPDGLQWTLNNLQSTKYFCLDALSTEDAISRMIVWTIHHYRVAPVAMVFHSAHWIVVRGYTASAAPGSSGDIGYTISGFDVNNPWPPTPMPGPPPPHSGGDVCGSGGMRGVADEHLTYATWQSDYMTGIQGGYWNGKFVAVCDPDPPPTRLPSEPAPRRRPFDGARIIEHGLAVEHAVAGLQEHGLDKRESWERALRGTKPGRPQLVQRLDRPDTYYWIVPMEGENGSAPVAVSVDARFGEYRQAIALPGGKGLTAASSSEEEVEKLVSGHTFDLPEPLGRLRARPEAICIYPHLVWRPGRESLSPFYPFRMVTVGSQRLYVRIADKAVFTHLTTDQRGI